MIHGAELKDCPWHKNITRWAPKMCLSVLVSVPARTLKYLNVKPAIQVGLGKIFQIMNSIISPVNKYTVNIIIRNYHWPTFSWCAKKRFYFLWNTLLSVQLDAWLSYQLGSCFVLQCLNTVSFSLRVIEVCDWVPVCTIPAYLSAVLSHWHQDFECVHWDSWICCSKKRLKPGQKHAWELHLALIVLITNVLF